MADPNVKDILEKYSKQLKGQVRTDVASGVGIGIGVGNGGVSGAGDISQEFTQFKQDMMSKHTGYERKCRAFGNFIKLKLAPKDEQRINGVLDEAHLDITPGQVVGLAFASAFGSFLLGLLLSVALFLITGSFPGLFLFLVFLTAGFLFYYFYTAPERLAVQWRLKASSQMIPCILYTVVYMKHTSNLERAVGFAAEHLEPPLGLDLKKVFWDVQVGRFSSIKESLDSYLESWRAYSPEFVESFNLIESSLYEPSDSRRVLVLERALQVILDGVYDKMLKFSHGVKAPLTNLYMLGIVLPTLGLALLPLASTLLGGLIKWYHIMILFNLLVPFLVFYMTSNIMAKRPGGYGEASNLEMNPLYPKFKSKKPYYRAAFICIPLLIIGLIPFILRIPGLANLIGLKNDYSFNELGIGFLGDLKLYDFIQTNAGTVGPMGIFALLLSLFIPLAIFLFFAIAYGGKTKEIIVARDKTSDLEKEFNNSLFKLGNRLGDGTPAEVAFGKVAESSRGLVTENFFKTVNSNIHSLGMSLEKAIFDPQRGAIIYYPSKLIATSMGILLESVKKGLKVAAQALMSISDYVKNINKIQERLKDLLADVASDMKSNMTFLAPLLAGIVVGLGSMITLILSKLTSIISAAGGTQTGAAGLGNIATITDLFKIEGMIPPYFLQIIIGVYIVQIIFILTSALVTVDAGDDKLKQTNEIGKNLMRGGLLYLIVALVSILALSGLAVVALSGLGV
jgi:hypothetical protein